MNMSGSCLCGSVEYTCSGEVAMAGSCHCSNCKKASGSGYAPTLFVPESSVKITGEVKYHESTGSSGTKAKRGFCPNCGSQLFGKPEAFPGMLAIRAGSLDDPSQYKPQVDIFTSRAPVRDCMDPSRAKFAEMPPRS